MPEGRQSGGHHDRLAMEDLMHMVTPSPQMDIALRDSTVEIRAGRQAEERVAARLDNNTVKVKLPDGHTLETKARFDPDKNELVVERSVSKGGSVVKKFSLTPNRDRLIVEVSVSGDPLGGRTVRQVYDRKKRSS